MQRMFVSRGATTGRWCRLLSSFDSPNTPSSPKKPNIEDVLFLDDEPAPERFHKTDEFYNLWDASRVSWKAEKPVPTWLHARMMPLVGSVPLKTLIHNYAKLEDMQAGNVLTKNAARYKVVEYGPKESVAYAAHRAYSNFSVMRRVLADVYNQIPGVFDEDRPPKRVLDFGSGTGSAVCASLDIWPGGLDHVTLVEPSKSMVDISNNLLTNTNKGPDDPIYKWLRGNSKAQGQTMAETREWNPIDRQEDEAARDGKNPRDGPEVRNLRTYSCLPDVINSKDAELGYDLVLSSYSLNSLPSDNVRAVAISILYDLVAENGTLVIVEEGSPRGAKTIQLVRETILKFDRFAEEDDTTMPEIIAPCTHTRHCPLGSVTNSDTNSFDSFCHFSQAVPRLFANSTNAGKTTKGHAFGRANFSYIVFRKVPREAAAQETKDTARILRPPLKRTRHVLLDVCTPDGLASRHSISKRKMKTAQAAYQAAKKSDWGGLWPVRDLEILDPAHLNMVDMDDEVDDHDVDDPWDVFQNEEGVDSSDEELSANDVAAASRDSGAADFDLGGAPHLDGTEQGASGPDANQTDELSDIDKFMLESLKGLDASKLENIAKGNFEGIDLSEFEGMDLEGMDLGDLDGMNLGDLEGMDLGDLEGMDLGDLEGIDLGDFEDMDLSKLESMDLDELKAMDFGDLKGVDLNKFGNLDLGDLADEVDLQELKERHNPGHSEGVSGTDNDKKR